MSRIFSVLAILALVLLAANFLLGLAIGDLTGASHRYRDAVRQYQHAKSSEPKVSAEVEHEYKEALSAGIATNQRMTLHLFLGVLAALVVVLVNSVSVTYFIGTSRWCKEVVETYRLSSSLSERSNSLKRRTFPYALLGILTILGIITLGALSDPGIPWRQHETEWFNATFPPARMVNIHYIAAMVGLVVLAFAFWMQAIRIAANYAVIDEILAQVQRIRGERGLSKEETKS